MDEVAYTRHLQRAKEADFIYNTIRGMYGIEIPWNVRNRDSVETGILHGYQGQVALSRRKEACQRISSCEMRKERGRMKKYKIENVGCDDVTEGVFEFTEEQATFLEKVFTELNEYSEYQCMPTIYIKALGD